MLNSFINENLTNIQNNNLIIEEINIPIITTKKMGGTRIKYKNLNPTDPENATTVIDNLCTKYEKQSSIYETLYDFIKNNDESINFEVDIGNKDLISKTIENDIIKINLDNNTIRNEGKYRREFNYHEYNQELLYYTETKIIDQNELLKIFTDSHTEYLLTLEKQDKYTIYDYTMYFYDLLNKWKLNKKKIIDDIYNELITRKKSIYINKYLNAQFCKVLNNYDIEPLINPAIIDYDTDNLLNIFIEKIINDNSKEEEYKKNFLNDIFEQYDIDLNRIIYETPPRIFSINLLRGSRKDYIFDDSNKFFKTNRFSSFTIDIFGQHVFDFSGSGSTSTIYDSLISPTANILYIAPISKHHNELEIIQATNQVLCKAIDNTKMKIYVYKKYEYYDENLLCRNVPERQTVFVRNILIT